MYEAVLDHLTVYENTKTNKYKLCKETFSILITTCQLKTFLTGQDWDSVARLAAQILSELENKENYFAYENIFRHINLQISDNQLI